MISNDDAYICTYCEHKNTPDYGDEFCDGDWFQIDCENCGKTIDAMVNINFTFNTRDDE